MAPTTSIPNGIRGEMLSRDPSVAAKTANDPFCVKTSTARFGMLALAEQERVRRGAPGGFGIPTLVLHGEADSLVPASASAILANAPGVERRTFPNLRHELHNEPEGPEIIECDHRLVERTNGRRALSSRRPSRVASEVRRPSAVRRAG